MGRDELREPERPSVKTSEMEDSLICQLNVPGHRKRTRFGLRTFAIPNISFVSVRISEHGMLETPAGCGTNADVVSVTEGSVNGLGRAWLVQPLCTLTDCARRRHGGASHILLDGWLPIFSPFGWPYNGHTKPSSFSALAVFQILGLHRGMNEWEVLSAPSGRWHIMHTSHSTLTARHDTYA